MLTHTGILFTSFDYGNTIFETLVPGLLTFWQGERGSNPRPHALIMTCMTHFLHNVTLSQRSKTEEINIIYANRRETIQ